MKHGSEPAMATDVQQHHILFQLLQTLDTGLIILDSNYQVQLWNGFMENHSNITSSDAIGKNLFELFSGLPNAWLKRKIDSVFRLQIRAFCTWEEHPRVFDFKSTRPLTGQSPLMYQNITLFPLLGVNGQVVQLCMQIFDVTEIATRKIALEAANHSLKLLSRLDRLTDLNNRGYWEETLEQEFQRCRRSSLPSSLMMLDVDHFKRLNDQHGHLAGDKVLRAVATQIKRCQRATDVAGRYGGEEFAVILPDTDLNSAMVVAERLRRQISEMPIEWEDQLLYVTASLGVCEFSDLFQSHQNWLDHCDAALYQAKREGRNRCIGASAPEASSPELSPES